MALHLRCSKINIEVCKFLSKKIFISLHRNVHNSCIRKNSLSTSDALDVFTSRLSQSKAEKWEILRSKKKYLQINPCPTATVIHDGHRTSEITNLSIQEIDALLKTAIDTYNCTDIMEILHQCIKLNKFPNIENLLNIASIRARCGDKDTVLYVKDFICINDPNSLEIHAYLDHYFAMAIWVKGNAKESLQLLSKVYKEYNVLRKRIRTILRYLVSDVTSSHSEATLILLLQCLEKLYIDYEDSYPLMFLWQECFLSEWFSDQQIALELLRRHVNLCQSIFHRIIYAVNISLRHHQVDKVYRLLELLLEFDWKSEYSEVLRMLFDYKFWQRDLRSCSEIIQWSSENDVKLTSTQYGNFLNLLLSRKDIDKMETLNEKKPNAPKMRFKF